MIIPSGTEARQIGHIVVTGANGFIGRRVVRKALSEGWTVTALARSMDWLGRVNHPRLKPVQWDIRSDLESLSLPDDVDVVCHLAAFLPPEYHNPDYAEECFSVNSLGTLRLLQAALTCRCRQFFYISSGQGYLPQERLASESDPVFPSQRATFYLGSKLLGELYTDYYRLNFQLPTAILRIASVYGPHMSKSTLVARFIAQLQQQQPVDVHDEGRHTVDFVYVDDVVNAILLAALNDARGIFNIGSGTSITTLQLAQQVALAVGVNDSLIRVLPLKSGSIVRGFSALDISKARDALGFLPTSLEAGLERLLSEEKAGSAAT